MNFEPLKILIVDDEPLAHDILAKYCADLSYIEVVGDCYDGISTLNFLNNNKVDAILLDIQMPDLTGIELLHTLQQNSPKIIFTTAYTEYALQGYEFDQVVDYLNKPIRLPRFIRAMERLKNQHILEVKSKDVVSQVNIPKKEELEFLVIKEDKTTYKLTLREITYVQSWGNYLKIFSLEDKVKIVRKTISELEDDLANGSFERIHKSYMVNTLHVKGIEGNQVIIVDQKLPIGRSYRIGAMRKIMGSNS